VAVPSCAPPYLHFGCLARWAAADFLGPLQRLVAPLAATYRRSTILWRPFLWLQVHTVGVGVAIGQSCMLLSAGEKGKRFMLEHATAMLHQPRVPPTGQRQAIEIQIKWREVSVRAWGGQHGAGDGWRAARAVGSSWRGMAACGVGCGPAAASLPARPPFVSAAFCRDPPFPSAGAGPEAEHA
jgi:hypothetical protein